MLREEIANKQVFDVAKETCRVLRKNATFSEKLLWREVRNRKFLGLKFYRQHPLFFRWKSNDRFFVADFYCADRDLVVEINGDIHAQQKDHDALRTHLINTMGVTVVRFTNDEIENDLVNVLAKLKKIALESFQSPKESSDTTLSFSMNRDLSRFRSSGKGPGDESAESVTSV